MKKSAILKLFSLVAFAAAGLLAIANFNSHKNTESVSADTTYSGSVIIEKSDTDARWDGCYLASYLFDSSHSAWGPKVANTNSHYQKYSWSGLSFDPTTIIMLRVPSNWDSSWGNPWWDGEGGIYARTGNVQLSKANCIWMKGDSKEGDEHSKWGTYNATASIKGFDKAEGGSQILDVALPTLKINGNDVLEVFGEVTLAADTYFKVVKGGAIWCNSFSTHSSIASNFELVEEGTDHNIHCKAAGTYEFYFAYNDAQLYITDPVLAAADEWAQYFLANSGCDSTGENLPSGWNDCATEYAKLSGGAKDLVYGTTAKADGSFIEQAVARYDHAVACHSSLTRFIVNSSSQIRPVNEFVVYNFVPNTNSNNLIVIVSIVALISASTLVCLIVIKRRRGIAK